MEIYVLTICFTTNKLFINRFYCRYRLSIFAAAVDALIMLELKLIEYGTVVTYNVDIRGDGSEMMNHLISDEVVILIILLVLTT